MVLDATLLNTQHCKVRIKGKVEQSRERSGALFLHLGVVAIEKRAFGSPSSTVANFTSQLKRETITGIFYLIGILDLRVFFLEINSERSAVELVLYLCLR